MAWTNVPVTSDEVVRLRVVLDDSWADEAAFQFYAEDSDRFTGDRDLELARELNPELKSFSDWAAEHNNELNAATN